LICEETVGVVVNNSWWQVSWQQVLRRFVLSALVLSLAATSLPPMAIAATKVAATKVAATKVAATTSTISEASPPATIQALRRKLDQYQPQVKILSPQPNQVLPETRVSLEFQVKDLPLYKDTTLGLGPHLHVFLDEENYQAVYDTATPLVLTDLKPGTHTIRVFASRPWHESFKNDGAFAQVSFSVLTPTLDDRPNPDLPLLTYSRPQGSYGAEPVMLDYYLTNAPLHIVAQDDQDVKDWRVKATIDGTSFILDRWQPIYLKGLKPGQNWAQLEFIDDKGNSIPNVFNNTVKLFDYQPGGTDTLSKLVRGDLTVDEAMPIVDQTYKPKPKPAVIPAVPAPKVTAPEAKKPEAEKPEAKPATEKVRAIPIVPIPVPVIKPPTKSIAPKPIEEVKPIPKPIEVKKVAPKPIEIKPVPMNQVLPKPIAAPKTIETKKPIEVKAVAPAKAKPVEVKPIAPIKVVIPAKTVTPAQPPAPNVEAKTDRFDYLKSYLDKPIQAKPIPTKLPEIKPAAIKPVTPTVKKTEPIIAKTKQTAKESVEAVKEKLNEKAPIEKAPIEKASINNLELPKNVRRLFDRLPMPKGEKPEELVPIGKLTK
jgi:hypothetical protein